MESSVKNNPAFPGLAGPAKSPEEFAQELQLKKLQAKTPSGIEAFWRTGFGRVLFRLTHWESWDWRIKYLIIAPAWLWFCLRARSFWFFTASNPTLTFGGFDGESKMEMYAHLPQDKVPKTVAVVQGTSFASVASMLNDQQLTFPLSAKPDAGKMGLMFRKIRSLRELKQYHFGMRCDYLVQEFVDLSLEVSVFYYRMPGRPTGTITGFVRKDPLLVTGDGFSTLRELIHNYRPVRFRLKEMETKHRDNLDKVLPAGVSFPLTPALNLSRGGRLISLASEKDDRLLKVFDDLSHFTGTFYYGRYDIKCASIEHLKQGDFCILEFNGSGAEPHHVYGNGYTLLQACRILVSHWSALCAISIANHQNGVGYWPILKGWDFLKSAGTHMKKLRQADADTAIQ